MLTTMLQKRHTAYTSILEPDLTPALLFLRGPLFIHTLVAVLLGEKPDPVSSAYTEYRAGSSAFKICRPVDRDTLRSALEPPINTATFNLPDI